MDNLLTAIKNIEPEFIELIRKRFGIIIHVYQTDRLVKIISDACQQFSYQPQDYLNQLKNCSSSASLLVDLVAAITIGESYFFRDKNQMNLLEKTVLPYLIAQKNDNRTLKIWSAGCASGEEIYTIVMLLYKLIPDINLWNLQLYGTDINTILLKKAAAGIYSSWSMRTIAESYVKRHFLQHNCRYILSSEICKLVTFKYLNLSDSYYPSTINEINEFDLILCRNVLIYFDNALIGKIMKRLSRCMTPNAYLFLGASDPIILTETNLIFHHDGVIYFTLENNSQSKKDFITDE